MFVMPRGAAPAEQEAAFAFLRWMMQPAQANSFATRTGYIPVSRRGLEVLRRDGYYAALPNDRVAVDQLAHAAPWPWSPELFRVQREGGAAPARRRRCSPRATPPRPSPRPSARRASDEAQTPPLALPAPPAHRGLPGGVLPWSRSCSRPRTASLRGTCSRPRGTSGSELRGPRRERRASRHAAPHARLQRRRGGALRCSRARAGGGARSTWARLCLRAGRCVQRLCRVVGRRGAPLDVDPRRRGALHRRAPRARPADDELARRSPLGAARAGRGERLEDHRLCHGHLPGRPPGHPPRAPRSGRARRCRPVAAVPPRDVAAAPPERRLPWRRRASSSLFRRST